MIRAWSTPFGCWVGLIDARTEKIAAREFLLDTDPGRTSFDFAGSIEAHGSGAMLPRSRGFVRWMRKNARECVGGYDAGCFIKCLDGVCGKGHYDETCKVDADCGTTLDLEYCPDDGVCDGTNMPCSQSGECPALSGDCEGLYTAASTLREADALCDATHPGSVACSFDDIVETWRCTDAAPHGWIISVDGWELLESADRETRPLACCSEPP